MTARGRHRPLRLAACKGQTPCVAMISASGLTTSKAPQAPEVEEEAAEQVASVRFFSNEWRITWG